MLSSLKSLISHLCHLQGSAIPDTCLMKYATVPPNANAEKIQLSKVTILREKKDEIKSYLLEKLKAVHF